jgi:Carbohydrate-binding module 48 (Isoamylase N-terminal domain)
MSDPKTARGVAVTARGLEAALELPNAEGASLCVYDGDREAVRIPMARDADGVLRGLAPGFGAGAAYGFRVEGPYDPKRGKRFDASKLLADPYAWAFNGPFRLHPSMFKFGEDSGPHVPKAIAGAPPEGEAGHKRIPPEALVIYELNLRGFSRANPAVPEAKRGTFAGLAHPASIEHLAKLGVTAVEVMPADTSVDERQMPALGLSDAWGYNSVVFGSPDPRLAPGGWKEVRAATEALHAAGIEAILDVVFNHNGESDEHGPTLSFRGLDNEAFFRLDPGNPELYINDAGTGNCLALDRPLVVEMAIGALRRWMVVGGFDGFRFDLAPSLGRRANGFDPAAPFFKALPSSPRRASSPSPGTWAPAAIASASSPLPSPNGTTASATPPAVSGAAIPASAARSQPAWPARATCSRAPRRRPRASTSSSSMMASRSTTSSPTTASTTRPTARTIATARTTTSAGTMASRVQPTIRRSLNPARATSAICSRFCWPRAGRRCWPWARSSASARAATTTPTRRTTRRARSTGAQPTLR